MTVRFNIWNYGNPGNPPVSNASQNRSYFLDVDWVKVSKVAPASVSVTEVGGVAVSPSTTTTVPNLAVVKGQVTATAGTVSMINVVIRRLSDNTKWKGYADGNGPAGWVAASQNVGISTNNAQPNWTTTGAMPSGSNLTPGDYQISADALSNGTYTSSPAVTVRIAAAAANATPISLLFGPPNGSTNVNVARATTASYSDDDGTDDIAICAVEIRQGNVATTAYYDVIANQLSLSDGNGGRTAGYAPGSANVISNTYISLDCANTQVFVNPGAKKVSVGWNFTPKQPLAGNNVVNLDVTDRAGAHAGFVQKATWTVVGAPTGNSAPVAVAFTPYSGSSSVGNPYATNAIYSDVNGIGDLKFLIVALVQGGQQTRAYYDVPTNRLYLQNDAGQYVGGVAPGTNAVISNSRVTLDCSQTSIFPVAARNEIQVRWRFIAGAGLAGVNDVYLLAFDAATASSGFQKRAIWTVFAPSSARSAGADPSAAQTEDSASKTTNGSNESPYVGEVPGGDKTKGFPKENAPDGTQGPPDIALPAANDENVPGATNSSASSVEQLAPSGQAS